MSIRLLSGAPCTVGVKIGSGGEGTVHRIAQYPTLAAKVFSRPPSDQLQRKLRAMLQIGNASLQSAAAWPTDLIVDGDSILGFVMPLVTEAALIDHVSHPGERRRRGHTVDYLFLATAARNLMDAARVLHAHGVVIGDVNESNVVVRRDATVAFIDSDSFQITHTGSVYRCGVGKDMYTPPELIGKQLSSEIRSPSHDHFGLAILVFQLLMHGRHPFHGVPMDGVDRDTTAAIRAGAYAHARPANGMNSPPPGSMDVKALGELGALFDRAFRTVNRPPTEEWIAALRRLISTMRPCPRNARHAVWGTLRDCAICAIPHDPLPSSVTSGADATAGATRTIADIVRDLRAVNTCLSLEDRCKQSPLSTAETVLPSAKVVTPQWTSGPDHASPSGSNPTAVSGVIAIVVGLACAYYLNSACFGVSVLGVLLLVAGLVKSSESERMRPRPVPPSRPPPPMTPLARAVEQARACESAARDEERALIGPLRDRVREARQLAERVESLHKDCTKLPPNVERQYQDEWIEEQLAAFPLDDGLIEGIGTERRRVLASFGIETAADVGGQIAYQVPGFGGVLTSRLMGWREECVRAIKRRGIPPLPLTYVQQIHAVQLNKVLIEARRGKTMLESIGALRTAADTKLTSLASAVDASRSLVRELRRQAQSAT